MQFRAFDSLKVLARTSTLSLITRYIFRETFGAWLIVVAVLFLILMTNQFAEILGDAAANRLPREAVFAIFGLTALRYLAVLTPIALFLGVMLALARLNRDCEMAALSACGVGPGRLLVPVTVLTALLAAGLSWLALLTTPEASRRIEEIKFAAEQELEFDALEAGRFTTPDSGDTVLYPRDVVGDELLDVFLQRQQGDRVVAILAERGRRVVDAATGALSFVLYNGRRYEGVPGDSEFLVVEFAEHGIPIRTEERKEFIEVVEAKSTLALLRSPLPADRAELQWRVSMPLSLFVLAFLAVPLSRSSPREGRYGRLGIGLLIYITYANLMSIARIWVERGLIAEWLGMWWVHVVFAAAALLMLGRASGWFEWSRELRVSAST
jgi:lipopolysaccharide export system permease protein